MCYCDSLAIIVLLLVILAIIVSFTYLCHSKLKNRQEKWKLEFENNIDRKERTEIFNMQIDAYRKVLALLYEEKKWAELKALAEEVKKINEK